MPGCARIGRRRRRTADHGRPRAARARRAVRARTARSAPLLIVAGGSALAWERVRPASFKTIGMVWAIGCTLIFASRDNFVRWFSGETPVASTAGAAATLLGGSHRARARRAALAAGAAARSSSPPGSASASRTSASSRPTSAAASLSSLRSWRPSRSGASRLSALLIGRSELVGRRLVLALRSWSSPAAS